jgi:flagellar protein FlaF
MGFASIVATALGIILLIVTAYVLVSGVLVASETVVEAQKDMTAIQVKMLGTSLEIEATNNTIILTNTGSEPIRDFKNLDIYIYKNGEWILYRTTSTGWSANNTYISPGKSIAISHNIESPYEVKVVTPNGISVYDDSLT